MAWWNEGPRAANPDPADQDGWLPAGLNAGWTYRDRVERPAASVAAFYASRYPHSPLAEWQGRLAAGEIHRNGEPLHADAPLAAGERLAWHRPPWREEAVPATWQVVHDDGDLLVIDKPSGLPVLPAGGWLEHTALRLLERRHRQDPRGLPRPVHRLGRFTSGLLVCARRSATRRWLSASLRESTAALAALRSLRWRVPKPASPRANRCIGPCWRQVVCRSRRAQVRCSRSERRSAAGPTRGWARSGVPHTKRKLQIWQRSAPFACWNAAPTGTWWR